MHPVSSTLYRIQQVHIAIARGQSEEERPVAGDAGSERPIATLISEAVEARVREGTSRQEIAVGLGYQNERIIVAFESGKLRVPIDKVPQLAQLLDFDGTNLLRLALRQYWPRDCVGLDPLFERCVSPTEFEVIRVARQATAGNVPILTPEMRTKLVLVFE